MQICDNLSVSASPSQHPYPSVSYTHLFDPLFLVVKGMQDKQMDVLNAIKLFSDEGLKSTGGLSNNSNGAPKNVRPIMDSALVAMAMMQGLTSAIVNPNDLRLMETIKSCDIDVYKRQGMASSDEAMEPTVLPPGRSARFM